MKIRELRFKNLNSLYGEWKIDFTVPDYAANGIFAITGPTGAGKSTILDALCLALYGKTPRIDRINKSGNEVMSRQTGECSAEVVFESQTGAYRCTWSQHRARGKADGKLAEAEHEIADALTGQLLESKKTAALAMIEEKTGMDMERFTRSILLAQGGFAAFLQARPDDRAPILEQITGTEIYSAISAKIFEHHKQARSELDILQAEAQGLTLLTDEQEKTLSERLADLQEHETVGKGKFQDLQTAILWLQGIEALKAQLAACALAETDLADRMAQFRPFQEKLARSSQAAELDGEYAALAARRSQKAKAKADLDVDLKRLPGLEQDLAERTEHLAQAGTAKTAARAEQRQVLPVITAVRILDIQIAGKEQQLKALEKENQDLSRQLAVNREACQKARRLRDQALAKMGRLALDIADHAADEQLVTELGGMAARLSHLLGIGHDRVEKLQKVTLLQKQLIKEQTACQLARDHFQAAEASVKTAQMMTDESHSALAAYLDGRLLREYHADLTALLTELALRQKISSLEEERRALVDGQACPLCGSVDHPYAAGNVPALSETQQRMKSLQDFIGQAERLEEAVQASEKRLFKAQTDFAEAEKLQDKAEANFVNTSNDLGRLSSEHQALTEQYNSLQADLLNELRPLGIDDLPYDRLQNVAVELQERLKHWQKLQQDRKSLESELLAHSSEISRLESREEPLVQASQEKQRAITGLLETRQALLDQRAELFSVKNPDQEEQRLALQVSQAEAAETAARSASEQCRSLVEQVKTRINQYQENMRQLAPELTAAEQTFAVNLQAAGFSDESDFIASRLPAEQRKALTDQAKQLADQFAELTNRRNDREQLLAGEEARQLTADSLENLVMASQTLNAELSQFGREIGAILQNLDNQAKARLMMQEKMVEIESQKIIWQKWGKLNELIGSQEGKKFRNFAQGITFELLTAHANRQLVNLTDRYLLVPDVETPLELAVVDNYQAGEVRSTKNLSGGESFIVSLALALGLSKMSSQKVRVDSLFLDEGFGTLDEDTLETALETLASLQQDGKLIGIISHVPALKERISTQITVAPVSGGRSVISGPGVSRG